MKLHVEETEPSLDYAAYLVILLDLLEGIRIYALVNEKDSMVTKDNPQYPFLILALHKKISE